MTTARTRPTWAHALEDRRGALLAVRHQDGGLGVVGVGVAGREGAERVVVTVVPGSGPGVRGDMLRLLDGLSVPVEFEEGEAVELEPGSRQEPKSPIRLFADEFAKAAHEAPAIYFRPVTVLAQAARRLLGR